MKHFRGTVEGPTSSASRSGTERSGLKARLEAPNVGILVEAYHEPESSRDVLAVYVTGGFKFSAFSRNLIAAVALSPDGTLETLGFNVEKKEKLQPRIEAEP